MHEQVVRRVVLLTFHFDDTGAIRHSRNASGTNHRVDLLLQEEVHQLGTQQTASGGHAERSSTEDEDLDGARGQEHGGLR